MSRLSMAFLGSGEFDPWSEEVDRWLLERSGNPSGPVLVLPTAAAHEGSESWEMWSSKGLEHYRSLGFRAEVVPLKERDDASDPDLVGMIERAAYVFFSGGNPRKLAEKLAGTPFWARLLEATESGLPYAGCSAGVACLTETTFDSDAEDLSSVWAPGLGYIRDALFGPHWDIVDTWRPGARQFIVDSVKPGQVFIGLDEETAMVGDGESWSVKGAAKVHVMTDGGWQRYSAGDSFVLPLPLADSVP
jgi:cyanophycinase